MQVIQSLANAMPADFRFPILTKLDNLVERSLNTLKIQSTSNPPLSMLTLKSIYKKHITLLDNCPLLVKEFVRFGKEFLQIIHSSDLCIPSTPSSMENLYIPGYGVPCLEDRSSIWFRNKNRQIRETIGTGEMRAAKYLADSHKHQDDMMRAIWYAIEASEIPWVGPKPLIPCSMKIYNECEPQVLAEPDHVFHWYEKPRKSIVKLVERFIRPVEDVYVDGRPPCQNHSGSLVSKIDNSMSIATGPKILVQSPLATVTKTEKPDDRMHDSTLESDKSVNRTWTDELESMVTDQPNTTSTPKATRVPKRTTRSLHQILLDIQRDNQTADDGWKVQTRNKKGGRQGKLSLTLTKSPQRKSRRIREHDSKH